MTTHRVSVSGRTTTEVRARLVSVPSSKPRGPLAEQPEPLKVLAGRLQSLWHYASARMPLFDADHPYYAPRADVDANEVRRDVLGHIRALASECEPAALESFGLDEPVRAEVRRVLRAFREGVEHGASLGRPFPPQLDVDEIVERLRDICATPPQRESVEETDASGSAARQSARALPPSARDVGRILCDLSDGERRKVDQLILECKARFGRTITAETIRGTARTALLPWGIANDKHSETRGYYIEPAMKAELARELDRLDAT